MRLAIAITLCTALLQACEQVPPSSATVAEASVPTGWTVIPAGTANLNAVSGVSDSAVWIVGDGGVIGRWDGQALVLEQSGTKVNLRGVWALNAQEAYAVGDVGTILKRTNSGSWQQVGAKLTREVLTSVWADTTRVVAVGSNGTVILGGATPYQLLANKYTENLFGVSGIPGGVVTAVGALGLLVAVNGTTVSRIPLKNGFIKLLTGVAATTPSLSYFVGQEGTVLRVDATGENPVPGCPPSALRSVSTVGKTAWVAGWDGTICEIAGAKVTSFPYTDKRWFNGIYAASASSLWVVGASGTLLHGLPLPPPPSQGAP